MARHSNYLQLQKVLNCFMHLMRKKMIELHSWILSSHPVWPFKGVSFCHFVQSKIVSRGTYPILSKHPHFHPLISLPGGNHREKSLYIKMLGFFFFFCVFVRID